MERLPSRIIPACFLAAVLTACAGAPATPSDAPPPPAAQEPPRAGAYYGITDRQIEARVGERFTLALEENLSTPIRWVVEVEGNAIVQTASDHSGQPPAGCAQCVGYPGTRAVQFEAHAVGEATLQLFDVHVAHPDERTARGSVHVRVAPK